MVDQRWRFAPFHWRAQSSASSALCCAQASARGGSAIDAKQLQARTGAQEVSPCGLGDAVEQRSGGGTSNFALVRYQTIARILGPCETGGLRAAWCVHGCGCGISACALLAFAAARTSASAVLAAGAGVCAAVWCEPSGCTAPVCVAAALELHASVWCDGVSVAQVGNKRSQFPI